MLLDRTEVMTLFFNNKYDFHRLSSEYLQNLIAYNTKTTLNFDKRLGAWENYLKYYELMIEQIFFSFKKLSDFTTIVRFILLPRTSHATTN